MGEEFYSIIKLMTGEEIFALVSVDDSGNSPLIILQNPLVMKAVSSSKGGFLKVRKWIELSDDDIFVLSYDKILTMSECKDNKIISIYNNYLEDEKFYITEIGTADNNVKNKLTDKMGYISTVNDARKYLEGIYKQSTKDS